MAYISYNILRKSEFDNIVSKRGKVQDLIINHIKINLYDTFKKVEKITTNVEHSDDSDVINKRFFEKKMIEKR